MKPVFIIAEAGVNHNGDINIARKMVEIAANSGADAIKFQTFIADRLVSRKADKANYQKRFSDKEETQFEMIKKLELSKNDHLTLLSVALENNIHFLSSPFDLESIELLNQLGIDTFKIPSGEITNLPYLKKIGGLQKKVILSTGMATLSEVGKALDILFTEGISKDNLIVLHTNTEYPTPFEDVNLSAMITIRDSFNIAVGYSDHTPGIEVAIAAVALGATIIEKHFTLDREMEGPDHKASLEPNELANMISAIRNIEKALGDGIKKPSKSEMINIHIARKSIHYSFDLECGHVLNEKDFQMIRPGNGISPMELHKVLHRELVKDVISGTQVNWEDIR